MMGLHWHYLNCKNSETCTKKYQNYLKLHCFIIQAKRETKLTIFLKKQQSKGQKNKSLNQKPKGLSGVAAERLALPLPVGWLCKPGALPKPAPVG